MPEIKRFFIIADIKKNPMRMFSDQIPMLAKGMIRLGHDVRFFSYCDTLSQLSPFKSKTISAILYKTRVDKLLAKQIQNYQPDIVHTSFPDTFDAETIRHIKEVSPDTVIIGFDGDPWPKRQKNRIETAKELDILTATNDGQWLQDYRDAGVPLCVFMPNFCDPDIEYRYNVQEQWKTDILWIGKLGHHAGTSETFREELVKELSTRPNCTLYGCCGRPKIGGRDFLFAISGARIGVNVNAYGPMKFCHSDRLTRFLACGTFVLAKRFPDADILYKDGEHLRYFDTIEEFFELAQWYLNHEQERKRIADAGMKLIHEQFNRTKIAGYILELVEKGIYSAPWF